ncbi:MAG: Type 1 glutamine amidotransferase-like domain-containing protein [Candidatus Delongbacteria bacterium]|nr:Type 1 glutamine amidotransferase-like domain-containing protein [Candidatus Delongbacteria bacterium]
MKRKLYLYGGLTDNFKTTLEPFVVSSGGKDAKIVVLLQGSEGWEKYIDGYKKPIETYGVKNISFIVPEKNSLKISDENLERIKESTGIFIGGGNTSLYIDIYCYEKVGTIIKDKYYDGCPYAGLSAGAILTVEEFCNEKYHANKSYQAYGLLKEILIVPHFIERNGFKELNDQFDKFSYNKAFGINEDICIEVIDEKICKVFGKSEAYFISKVENMINLKKYSPNDEFEI